MSASASPCMEKAGLQKQHTHTRTHAHTHTRMCRIPPSGHLGVVSGFPTIGVAKKLLEVEGLDAKAVRQALEGLQQQQQHECSGAEAGGPGEVGPRVRRG